MYFIKYIYNITDRFSPTYNTTKNFNSFTDSILKKLHAITTDLYKKYEF